MALIAAMPGALRADDRDPCLDNARPIANAGSDQTVPAGTRVDFDAGVEEGLSFDPDGRGLNYFIWYFGDGEIGRGATASHTYHQPGVYAVRLTVTDDCRARGSDTAIVVVTDDDGGSGDPCDGNMAPVARVSGSFSGEVDQAMSFRGNTSSDADGTIASYAWDFGDGSSSTGPIAGHVFHEPGDFSVTLTVTDDCGATHSASMSVSITEVVDPCEGNNAPSANPGNNRSASTGASVLFSGALSSDSDGVIVSYQWNFGDATSALGRNVAHAYSRAGAFFVVLTVVDDCGASHSRTIVVTVVNANPCAGNSAPRANAGSGGQVEVGSEFAFDGSNSWDQDLQDTLTFRWTFGDGTTSSAVRPTHAFQSAGTFTVTLQVTDNCGASHTDSVIVDVRQPDTGEVEAVFVTATPEEGALSLDTVTFHASTPTDLLGRVYYRWDFGDGSYPGYGDDSVGRTFAEAGTYHVSVTLINKATWQIEGSASTEVSILERLVEIGDWRDAQLGVLKRVIDIAASGSQVWAIGQVSWAGAQLAAMDTSDPENPVIIGRRLLPFTPLAIAASPSFVAVSNSSKVLLFDASDSPESEPVGEIILNRDYAAYALDIAIVQDRYLVVAAGWSGLLVFDISNAAGPELVGSPQMEGFPNTVDVLGHLVFVGDRSEADPGIQIVDFANVHAPVMRARIRLEMSGIWDVDVQSNVLGKGMVLGVVESDDWGSEIGNGKLIELFDVSNPNAPSRFGALDVRDNVAGGVFSVVLGEHTLFAGSYGSVHELEVPAAVGDVPTLLAEQSLNQYFEVWEMLVDHDKGIMLASVSNGIAAILESRR